MTDGTRVRTQRRCPRCEAVWSQERARFCGRCGALLVEPPARPRPRSDGDLPLPRIVVGAVLALVVLAGSLMVSRDVARLEPAQAGGIALPAPPRGDGAWILWRRSIEAPPSRPPTVAGDATVVVVGGADGQVVALDRRTGTVRWTIAGPGRFARPLGPIGDVVAVAFDSGTVVGYGATSGRERWRVEGARTVHYAEAYRLTAGTLVVSTDALTAVPDAPAPGWTHGAADLRSVSVGLADGAMPPVLIGEGRVASIDPLTGRERWQARIRGVHGPVVAVGGTLAVADGSGQVHGLDAITGRSRWTLTLAPASGTRVRLSGGEHLLARLTPGGITGGERRLVGIDAGSGEVRWERQVGDVEVVATTADRVVVTGLADAGDVAAIDPATGATHWTRRFETAPVTAHVERGRAVVRAGDTLAVLDVADGRVRRGPLVWPELQEVLPGDPMVVATRDAVLALVARGPQRGTRS